MKNEYIFFNLIRVAIGNQDSLFHVPSLEEWCEIYAMAQKQGLLGICFVGIQRLQKHAPSAVSFVLAQKLYLRWMGISVTIQQRNKYANKRCLELSSLLREGGFDVAVLKGQSVARRYGELALFRQSGDIDVWLSGERSKIKNFFARHYKIGDIIYNHAHVYISDDSQLSKIARFEVEAHFTPSWLYSPFCNHYLQNWFKGFLIGNEFRFKEYKGFKSPSLEFDLVFLLLHSYRHFMHEGLSLRQVMDYYFCLKEAFLDKSGTESYELKECTKKIVKDIGLEAFAEAMMWVIELVFHLNLKNMPWVPNKKRGQRLLNDIMMCGNMGCDNPGRLKGVSRFRSFMLHVKRQFRFVKDYPCEVLWSPLWKIWHFMIRELGII